MRVWADSKFIWIYKNRLLQEQINLKSPDKLKNLSTSTEEVPILKCNDRGKNLTFAQISNWLVSESATYELNVAFWTLEIHWVTCEEYSFHVIDILHATVTMSGPDSQRTRKWGLLTQDILHTNITHCIYHWSFN